MSATPPITCSRVELARLLGVDESTLYRWRKEGMPGSPARGRGGSEYDPAQVIAWCRATGKLGSTAQDEDALDKDQEQALYVRQKRLREEMENAARRGELVEVADVERAWSGLVVACRSKLLGIPSKAARLVKGLKTEREIAAVLTRLVQEGLRELAGDDDNHLDGAAGASDVCAAAGTDGQPVGGCEPPPVKRGKRRTGGVGD